MTDSALRNTLATSVITRVEAAAAFAMKYRFGAATLAERDAAFRLLVLHATTEYELAPVNVVLDQAVMLTQNHRLCGYDAVQLATALAVNAQYLAAALPALIFLSADDDLLAAARAEGLDADNPNAHS